MKYQMARYAKASELLGQVLLASGPADGVVDRYFKAHRNMGSTDRRFAGAVVYGCLRRQRELLAMAQCLAPGADEPTAAGLLTGLYLMTADGWLPDDFEHTDFAVFAATHGHAIKHFDRARLHPAEQLNLPDWLYASLQQQLPATEVEALAAALDETAPVDLRVNLRQCSRAQLAATLAEQGIDTVLTPLAAAGLRRLVRGPLQNTPAFKAGWFEFQDEGSQLIGWLLQPQAGEFIVDYCAGAGGKTLQLADMMADQGSILACDVAPRRLAQLAPRLQRAAASIVTTRVLQPDVEDDLADYAVTADAVLVDAPCSGSGTLRRAPDLRWRPVVLAELCQTQTRVLASASQLVKAGGRLGYVTCSLLAEENQQVIAAFLASHPDFVRCPLPQLADDPTSLALARQDPDLMAHLQRTGELQLWPHRHHTDGFFAQVLRRLPRQGQAGGGAVAAVFRH